MDELLISNNKELKDQELKDQELKDQELTITTIDDCLEKDIQNIFKKSWIKLERGSKIIKLKEYAKNKNIVEDELLDYFNKGLFNKKTIVDYDETTGIIVNINCILFNKDGTYKINVLQKKKKHKPCNKSKSNIERIIKST